MTVTNGYPEVKIHIEELAKMIAHKCQYCKYEQSQCSEKNGCEIGILNWLKDEIRNN